MAYHRRLFSFSKVRRLRNISHRNHDSFEQLTSHGSSTDDTPQRQLQARLTRITKPILQHAFPLFFLIIILFLFIPTNHVVVSYPAADPCFQHVARAAITNFFTSNDATRPHPSLFSDDTRNARLLIDKALIPPVFVSRLSSKMHRQLLRRLTMDSNGLVIFSSIPKVIVVDLQNGLGNRLRALASALDLAYELNRVPIIVWAPDAHINATLYRLFHETVIRNLIVIEKKLPWPMNGNEVWSPQKHLLPRQNPLNVSTDIFVPPNHPSLSSFRYISFMEKDKGFHPPSKGLAPPDMNGHIYFKTGYIIHPQWSRRYSMVNTFMQALRPAPEVMQIVHNVQQRCGGIQALRRMVGVHIRALPLALDSAEVDHECEYSIIGAERTNSYRLMSAPENFIPEMERIQKNWANIVKFSAGMTAKEHPLTFSQSILKVGRIKAGWRNTSVISSRPTSTFHIETKLKHPRNNSSFTQVNVATADRNPAEEPEVLRSVIEVDLNEAPRFFVSVDSAQAVNRLRAVFGKETIVSIDNDCEGRTADCIMYAFADLVLLSRTAAMLQSGWSSFSEAADRLRIRANGMDANRNDGYLIRTSGTDFGKPASKNGWREPLAAIWPDASGVPNEVTLSQEKRRELCEARRKRADEARMTPRSDRVI